MSCPSCRCVVREGVTLSKWYCVVATWFGCGMFPRSPGTAGSAAALLFFPLVIIDNVASFLLFFVLFVVGTVAVDKYLMKRPGESDPKEVVIDEVCGQLLVYIAVRAMDSVGLVNLQVTGTLHNSVVFMLFYGLVAFRVYDIVKPWPVDAIDRNVHGAWGVMLDDVAAAVPASVVTLAAISASIM